MLADTFKERALPLPSSNLYGVSDLVGSRIKTLNVTMFEFTLHACIVSVVFDNQSITARSRLTTWVL